MAILLYKLEKLVIREKNANAKKQRKTLWKCSHWKQIFM